MTIYMVCATRTNLVYVIIFAALIPVFALLAAAYWRLGVGDKAGGERLVVVCPALSGLAFDPTYNARQLSNPSTRRAPALVFFSRVFSASTFSLCSCSTRLAFLCVCLLEILAGYGIARIVSEYMCIEQ